MQGFGVEGLGFGDSGFEHQLCMANASEAAGTDSHSHGPRLAGASYGSGCKGLGVLGFSLGFRRSAIRPPHVSASVYFLSRPERSPVQTLCTYIYNNQ